MKAARLLAHYDEIADAPNAVDRLRRFVLELAVRGKLVAQDPKDEPASVLLKQISLQKAKLTSERKTSGPVKTTCVEDSEMPFRIPDGWVWTRLGEVVIKLTDGTHHSPPNDTSGDFKYVTAKNIKDHGVVVKDITYVSRAVHDEIFARCNPEPGDILYIKDGATTGVVTVNNLDEPFSMLSSVALLKLPTFLFNRLIVLFLRSPFFFDQMRGFMKGAAIPRVTLKRMAPAFIPIPPFAEQYRIVAKVDELMALCDQLEIWRSKREINRDRLTASSLAKLNMPDLKDFLEDVDFVLAALPSLTSRADQIMGMRRAILNLAVRGRLVPQNPNDEPAIDFLKRFAAAKAKRKKDTGDARIKLEDDPKFETLPIALPPGWAVQSFENLFLFIDYRGNTPPKTEEGIPLITAKNIRMGYLNREPREYISKATFSTWMTRGFPKVGDLLFTTEAPLANVCLNDIEEPFALAQRAICFRPYAKINTKYLMFALMSEVMQSLIESHATGMTAKGIKAANLKPLPIPIPPFVEQERIVAKVETLLGICEQLEANLDEVFDKRHRLLDVLLAEAIGPAE